MQAGNRLLELTPNIDGSYGDASGETRYTFSPGGRVEITILNTTVSAEYTLDDDKIIIASPQGTVVLKWDGESLYGPMGLELTRNQPRIQVKEIENGVNQM